MPKCWASKKPNNIQISKAFGPEALEALRRRRWPLKHVRFRTAASSFSSTTGNPKQIEHANRGHESCDILNQNVKSSSKCTCPKKTNVRKNQEEGGAPQLAKFPQRQCPKDCDSVTLGEKKVPHGMILTYHGAEMSSSLAEKHCHKRNTGPSVLFLVASVELNSSISPLDLGLGTLSPCETCRKSTFPCVWVPGFFPGFTCHVAHSGQSNFFHLSNFKS